MMPRILLSLLSIAFLFLCAGCVSIEDCSVTAPDTIIEEHYTVEVDGRRIPVKNVTTTVNRKKDGTIVLEKSIEVYDEGTEILQRLKESKETK